MTQEYYTTWESYEERCSAGHTWTVDPTKVNQDMKWITFANNAFCMMCIEEKFIPFLKSLNIGTKSAGIA